MGYRSQEHRALSQAWRAASSCSRPVSCLPAVPGTLSLNTSLQMPGDTLNLTLLTSHETANLNWFLQRTGSPRPVLLQPGTHVSLTSSQGQAVLSIFNISHKWEGSQLSPPLLFLLLPLSFLLFSSSFPFSPSHLFILGNKG